MSNVTPNQRQEIIGQSCSLSLTGAKLFFLSVIMQMAHDPKLTFSPACPFTPWDQSQQTQSHAKRCEGERDTREKEEPVLETWRGFGACSILRTSDGEVGKELRGVAICGS